MVSMSMSSSLSPMSGANFPPIVAWKVQATSGSLSFSRSNLSLGWFGFLAFFRRTWKVIITRSWSLPMSAPGKLLVLWMLIPDRKRFFTLIWLWYFLSGLCHVHLLDGLWGPRVFVSTRSLKVANSRRFQIRCTPKAKNLLLQEQIPSF